MTQDEPAVVFENVTKRYKLYKNERARFLSIFSKKVKYREKIAVSELCFTINKGESVAFLGRNGAGKSTVLKMITGVSYPSEGEITVNGRVSALLELGAGFNAEFTGRENIYLKCNIMGMDDDDIAEIIDDIVDFAALKEYIDQPIRTYSSGMRARLGFAINVSIDPEILIVDEALSVGDRIFRDKCLKRVEEIMENGDTTLLFVTHSNAAAKQFCKRGIVMKNGQKMFDGGIDSAIEYYAGKDA